MSAEEREKLIIDNIVYVYEKVPRQDFDRIVNALSYVSTHLGAELRHWIGKRAAEYRYNFVLGQGEGAITIQYEHNSADTRSNEQDLRVEFNPQKVSEMNAGIFRFLQGALYANITVRALDVAVDVRVPPNGVFVDPITGRDQTKYNDTRYFGSRKNTGYLKVYNKKAEREEKTGESVDAAHLTRIEYTWRGKQELGDLARLELDASKYYNISIIEDENIGKGELYCFIRCIRDGLISLKDLTRTNQKKVRAALEQMKHVDLDELFREQKDEIIALITEYALGVRLDSANVRAYKAIDELVREPMPSPSEVWRLSLHVASDSERSQTSDEQRDVDDVLQRVPIGEDIA